MKAVMNNVEKLHRFIHIELGEYKGIHGIDHFANVESFGMLLASKTGADVDVVRWFAYLHDCQRHNDGSDIQHGERAAEYIDTIRNTYLQYLDDGQVDLLKTACRYHTTTPRLGNSTIDSCFDADRLDLPRVGIVLNPDRMATEYGKELASKEYDDNLQFALIKQTEGSMLEFYKQYISLDEPGFLGIRFNVRCEDGKLRSPFRGDVWPEPLFSVSESCPYNTKFSTSKGIYIVPIESYFDGIGINAFTDARKNIHGNNEHFAYHLIEYFQSDLIYKCPTGGEACVRQCNIVKTFTEEEFAAIGHDELIKVYDSWLCTKPKEINTYAHPYKNPLGDFSDSGRGRFCLSWATEPQNRKFTWSFIKLYRICMESRFDVDSEILFCFAMIFPTVENWDIFYPQKYREYIAEYAHLCKRQLRATYEQIEIVIEAILCIVERKESDKMEVEACKECCIKYRGY